MTVGYCPTCRKTKSGLVGHTVEFNDDPNNGWVRNGCVTGYVESLMRYSIQLLTGEEVQAQAHEFTVDRLQTLVNYPDAYGRSEIACPGHPTRRH